MVSQTNARTIREMTPEERKAKLKEMREELMHQRGLAKGGAPQSPGKVRSVRTAIARLLTIMNEKGERPE